MDGGSCIEVVVVVGEEGVLRGVVVPGGGVE
jgi:hypothetical protein